MPDSMNEFNHWIKKEEQIQNIIPYLQVSTRYKGIRLSTFLSSECIYPIFRISFLRAPLDYWLLISSRKLGIRNMEVRRYGGRRLEPWLIQVTLVVIRGRLSVTSFIVRVQTLTWTCPGVFMIMARGVPCVISHVSYPNSQSSEGVRFILDHRHHSISR